MELVKSHRLRARLDVCSTANRSLRISCNHERLADQGSDCIEGSLLERGLTWYLTVPDYATETSSNVIPHVAGMTAVGLSYMAAGALVAADGPLPFGDAIAVGILAVPDVVWYGIGYSLFD